MDTTLVFKNLLKRTSTLNPSQYNELFMSVTNELRHLALYLDELIDTGNGLEVGSSLYEQVQYNNSIIPRLYLMITVTGINEHFCSCLRVPSSADFEFKIYGS